MSSKAKSLLCSLKQGDFLICAHVLAKVFTVSLPLNRQLQNEDMDLALAMEISDEIISAIVQLITVAEEGFKPISSVDEKINKVLFFITSPLEIPSYSKT